MIYEKVFQKDAHIEIYIEKVSVAEVQDFVKAVTILIAAHYVYNLAYSKKLHSTYCFIQKYILEAQGNSNCPTKVLNLNVKIDEKQFNLNMEQCFVLVYFKLIFC